MISYRLFSGATPLGIRLMLGFLALLAVLVPLLNLALSPDNPLHVPAYIVALLGKYLCYALLALSLDLVWVVLWLDR